MDTNHKPVDAAGQAGGVGDPCAPETGNTGHPTLPLAQRIEDISEGDVETLRRIAEDKASPAGRPRRAPRTVPTVEPVATED